MYYGSQYYRPPFPNKEQWEKDIAHMKELNFNTIKLWAVWNWIEREPGVYDFSELDELVEICAKYGLKVIMNTIPEGAPYWTSTGYEDSFYTTSKGEALSYSGPANLPSAGWPGLCPDGEKPLSLMCDFIYETSKHYANNDAVFCIDVWNEPHLEPMYDYSNQLLCYCVHSQEKFKNWLKERYTTLENLNTAWFRQYQSWDQVEPPRRFGTSADMIDWRRFWLYNLADWLRSRVAAARKGAPDKVILTHVAFSGYMGIFNDGGLANELGDDFLLAKEVDMFGLSSFPLWAMGEKHVEGHFLNTEIVAEASRGKPFFQVELQGGAGKKGLLGGLVPSHEDVRQWNLSVIAAGGKGVVYWQYKPEPAGQESPGFGQVNPDGSDTPRSLSAAECAKRFNRADLSASRRCLSTNGIYLSRNSDLMTYAANEEHRYTRSFRGVYQSLIDRGIPSRFVHADYISEAFSEGVKNLYVPMGLCLSNEEKNALIEFANAGGTLIVEGCTGMYQENGEMDDYFTFLHTLFGMKGNSIDAAKGDFFTASHSKCGKRLKFWGYRQMFQEVSSDCSVNAVFDDGHPAVLERAIGKGKAVWVGGFAGAAYQESLDVETGDFIAAHFDSKGYEVIEKLSCGKIVVRLLEDDNKYYAVCLNREKVPRQLTMQINGHTLQAWIPPEDGKILEFLK